MLIRSVSISIPHLKVEMWGTRHPALSRNLGVGFVLGGWPPVQKLTQDRELSRLSSPFFSVLAESVKVGNHMREKLLPGFRFEIYSVTPQRLTLNSSPAPKSFNSHFCGQRME